jgi:hypothetical protein
VEAEPPDVEVTALGALLGHDDRVQILDVHTRVVPPTRCRIRRSVERRRPPGR